MEAPEPDEKSIGDLFQQLVEDGRGYAEAEIGYYRTLFRSKLRDARTMLWMGGVALALAFSAAVALVVGLVLTLAPVVGPGFATLIVVVAFLAISGLMGWLAWTHVKRIFKEKP
ncbi:phage holin family protein [Sphingomonas sp. KR3-1]|uniref:phage holin family protein n=1 Tax=Sphingomonas sp. KR3-1 TaxID=3156611 RepID=UPI0032B3D612